MTDITSVEQYRTQVKEAGTMLVVVFFWAEFHEPSKRGGQMDTLVSQLAKAHADVRFVEAEALPDVSSEFGVSVVPSFVFLKNGVKLGMITGVNPAELARSVMVYKAAPAPQAPAESKSTSEEDLNERLRKLINAAHVMLFMKGSPQEPKCKFSRQIVELLAAHNVKYSSFDILQDESVRQGLKTLSNWPTYPQIYVAGKLIGGLDIVKDMAEEGNMGVFKAPEPAKPDVTPKLVRLIGQAPVVLFMKGTPQDPQCGFSERMVKLLSDAGVSFVHFDILSDPAVREGLKTYSNWPTYPQLYVKGKFVGGLDIVQEMAADSTTPLSEQLGLPSTAELNARLQALVSSAPNMLFMKGTPDEPRCGFSRKAVELLRATGVAFGSFDILSDPEVRQGLKDLFKWPTFPQLYHNGKLIGGVDIMTEMAEDGELAAALTA